jgi:hypothetical protein
VLFPGLGDAVGFRLKVMQELTHSTPVHFIHNFIDFTLWQETGIPPSHLSLFQTNQQEFPVLKVSVMLESKNGICGMENQNKKAVLNNPWHVEVLLISEFCFI